MMKKLKIHDSKRYLMYDDGEPFFYMADTAWDLFLRLTREEFVYYLSVRAKQEFNVIQAVMVAGMGQSYEVENKYGRTAFLKTDGIYDPKKLDDDGENSYWKHIDWCVKKAAEYGVYFALLPLWNSMYYDKNTTIFKTWEKAYAYGAVIARRYIDYPNIIWMLGGDCGIPKDDSFMRNVNAAVYYGIKSVDREHLVTFHPCGPTTSVDQMRDKINLDFNTCQSGHALDSHRCYELTRRLANSGKPFLDSESHYEDHVANWEPDYKPYDDADVRQSNYWNILEGACGQTYGNPYVLAFIYEPVPDGFLNFYIGNNADSGWMDALHHNGAEQMKYLKKLRLSRPYFELRCSPELVLNSEDDLLFGHIGCARGNDYAYIYLPLGQPVKVDASILGGKMIKASWYNPRNGDETLCLNMLPDKALFVPPTCGRGNDWVMILDVIR